MLVKISIKYRKICFKKCLKLKLKLKPYPTRRYSVVDFLPIYYLLIIAVPDYS